MDKLKLIKEQESLAKKLVLKDEFEDTNLIAGASSIYSHDSIISSIIIFDKKQKKVIEKKFSVEKATFTYHKDFISYRECPNLMKAFHMLRTKPDVMFVEGDGILHPRRMGLASAFGLFTDLPTIGVNSSLLFGKREGDAVYDNKEILAKLLETKQNAKPIFVSQGHKISLSTALEITKEQLQGHKLPEPLYLAHKYATKIKNKFKDKISNKEEIQQEQLA